MKGKEREKEKERLDFPWVLMVPLFKMCFIKIAINYCQLKFKKSSAIFEWQKFFSLIYLGPTQFIFRFERIFEF